MKCEEVLTVGDTLVLDLQVLVGARTGVWEDVGPCHHGTLGPVVTPGGRGGVLADGVANTHPPTHKHTGFYLDYTHEE